MREFEAGKYNMVTVLGNDLRVTGELSEYQILGGMMQKEHAGDFGKCFEFWQRRENSEVVNIPKVC